MLLPISNKIESCQVEAQTLLNLYAPLTGYLSNWYSKLFRHVVLELQKVGHPCHSLASLLYEVFFFFGRLYQVIKI